MNIDWKGAPYLVSGFSLPGAFFSYPTSRKSLILRLTTVLHCVTMRPPTTSLGGHKRELRLRLKFSSVTLTGARLQLSTQTFIYLGLLHSLPYRVRIRLRRDLGVLSYMGYIGMSPCEGYGFQTAKGI